MLPAGMRIVRVIVDKHGELKYLALVEYAKLMRVLQIKQN